MRVGSLYSTRGWQQVPDKSRRRIPGLRGFTFGPLYSTRDWQEVPDKSRPTSRCHCATRSPRSSFCPILVGTGSVCTDSRLAHLDVSASSTTSLRYPL